MLELRQLRHFLAVCDHGNYARAAEAVATSQSTITKSVHKLEAALGARLFERGQFGAVPTPFGLALAVRARAMCSEERTAIQEIDALKGGRSGTVNLGAGLAFSYRLLPEAIARFNHRRPGVGIEVTEGTSEHLFGLLMAGSLDLVVSSPASDFVLDPALSASPLFLDLDYHDYIVVGTSNPLAGMSTVSPGDLAAYPWVVARSADHVLSRVDNLFEQAGLPPPIRTVRTDSATLVKSLLTTGGYVGVLGLEFFRAEADLGLLKALPVPGFDWPRRALITRRRRSPLSAVAQAFISELRATAEDTPREAL